MEGNQSEYQEVGEGCYGCGGLDGTLVQLCPSCVARNVDKRASLKERLAVDPTGVHDPFFYRITNLDSRNRNIIAAAIVVLLLVVILINALFKLSFAVTFLLMTALLATLLVLLSLLVIIGEAFVISPALGFATLVFFPLAPLLALLPKDKIQRVDAAVSLNTAVGALTVGVVLLVSSFFAARLLGVQLIKPATYYRAAAPFEGRASEAPPRNLHHHFE